MIPATRTTVPTQLVVLGTAVGVGIGGDMLLRAMPWGLNLSLWLLLLLGAGAAIAYHTRVELGPDARWLAITALLLALGFARRDSENLQVYTILALVTVLGVMAASARGVDFRRADVATWLHRLFGAGFSTVVGMVPLTTVEMPWDQLRERGRLRHAAGVGVGLLVAAPLLLIFGALFMEADAVFANVVTNVVRPEIVVPHVFWSLFWTALAGGWLRHALLARAPVPAPVVGSTAFVPVITALGLVSGLFLLFVAVQLRYLFGGASMVEATLGLTYAEYARNGFFELVTASGLVLPVLVGAEWAVRAESPERRLQFRRLAGVLLGLVGIIVVSALERMRLYVAAYGMSTDRLYATAGEGFLLGLFAWFAVTALRARPERFAFGAFVWALLSLASLHALNPDAFVARWNVARPADERPFDAAYAAGLSADAAPTLFRALPNLAPADRCIVARGLARWSTTDSAAADWRSWNASRATARRLAQQHAAQIDACPAPIAADTTTH